LLEPSQVSVNKLNILICKSYASDCEETS
jgi:hypothetical protein